MINVTKHFFITIDPGGLYVKHSLCPNGICITVNRGSENVSKLHRELFWCSVCNYTPAQSTVDKIKFVLQSLV